MSILPAVIIGVMGLALAWPAFPAQAEPDDRAHLQAIASGLDVLRNELVYKLALINPDDKDHDFYCSAPVYFFSSSREFVVALEFYPIAATAEDQAKMENLIKTLRQLDSAAEIYVKTLRNICPALQKNRMLLLSPLQEPRYQEEGTGQTTPQQSYASGSLAPGSESDVFPSYAVVPSEAEIVREQTRLARETAKLAWTDLELQYKVALNQIEEFRNHLGPANTH